MRSPIHSWIANNADDLREASSGLAFRINTDDVPPMRVFLSIGLVFVSGILLYLQVDPVPTWFYVFAWYPTLVLLDALGTRLDGRPTALWRRSALFAFGWSPVVWLLFEAANFRLANWYYVFLPHALWERWTGILLSFATVVPAVLLAERALDAAGVFKRGLGPVVVVRTSGLWTSVSLGCCMAALALVYPKVFFPLIWGAAVLLAEPLVFLRAPGMSLIGDLARGYWGRIGRLMLGGLAIGLLWESLNYWARGKWIYTVPWLEHTKLFEMPPFGFLGFPVFALEAWAMFGALCACRIARPFGGEQEKEDEEDRGSRRGDTSLLPWRAGVAAGVAIVMSVLILLGMERWTISSTAPRLQDLPGITHDQIAVMDSAGYHNVGNLVAMDIVSFADATGMSVIAADRISETARLASLRGIGTHHTATLGLLGVHGVCDLARQDPDTLLLAIEGTRRQIRPTRPEVAVWVRAAARECHP